MKKLFVMALVCAAALLGAAEKNLAPAKWYIYGKKSDVQSTEITKEGVVVCNSKVAKGAMTGVFNSIIFAQPITGSITFGGESKAENVQGATDFNYCVYLDMTYADGTKQYGLKAPFKGGTHDWEKKSTTFKLPKPVKGINFYVLFRNCTGQVEFRNMFFYNK